MKRAILSAALLFVPGVGTLHAQATPIEGYCGTSLVPDPPEPPDDFDKVPDAIRKAALGLLQYLQEQARTIRDQFDSTEGLPIDPDRLLPFLEDRGAVFADLNDPKAIGRLSRVSIARLVSERDDKVYKTLMHLGYTASRSHRVRWKAGRRDYELRIGNSYALSLRTRGGRAAVYKIARLSPGE